MQTIYWAKSHKSSALVPLNARTLLGAKREAWGWITERCTGVTILVAGDEETGMYTAIAVKCVCPITGKVEQWKEV